MLCSNHTFSEFAFFDTLIFCIKLEICVLIFRCASFSGCYSVESVIVSACQSENARYSRNMRSIELVFSKTIVVDFVRKRLCCVKAGGGGLWEK